MIANFTEYEKTKFSNYLLRATIYDQISIAKDICPNRQGSNCITILAGYFWKGNMINKAYTISGPIISLGLNL
jgi:hypothetical protein